jgi:hypothetical protein
MVNTGTDNISHLGEQANVKSEMIYLSDVRQGIVENAKCADNVALLSVIAALAAAAQDGFVIESPLGGVKPLSMLFCISAPSGTGKSTALRLAFKSVHEHEQQNKDKQEKSEILFDAMEKKYQIHLKKLNKEIIKAQDEDTPELESKLVELVANKPVLPKTYRRIVSNSTLEGLFKHYGESRYGPFVEADEGRNAMNLLMNDRSPIVSKLYDGDDISISRASSKSHTITSPRLSGIFMLQPELLIDYIEKHGSKGIGSGLWARIITYQVDAYTQIAPIPKTINGESVLSAYNERIRYILKLTDDVVNGFSPVNVLQLTEEATKQYHLFISKNNHFRNLNQLSDGSHAYISRAQENLMRVAGLLHMLKTGNAQKKIDEQTFLEATAFIDSAIMENLRLFENGGLDPEKIAQSKLLQQMSSNFMPGSYITKSQVHNVAPRYYRGKGKRLDEALERLNRNGAIHCFIAQSPHKYAKPITRYQVAVQRAAFPDVNAAAVSQDVICQFFAGGNNLANFIDSSGDYCRRF